MVWGAPSLCLQGLLRAGGKEERRKGPLWLQQGVLAAKFYLLVSLLLPCCYINIMNCSQVHQMRFRWSLGALLPKQAKLGRTDASGKLQSLSRSTKLELMKVGAHIWPRWPSQQWGSGLCLTLACQEVLSTFTCVVTGQMGWASQGNCVLTLDNDENKNDGCHGSGLTVCLCRFYPGHKGSRTKGQIRADSTLWYAPCPACPAWAASPAGGSTFSSPFNHWHKVTVCSANGSL